MGDGRPDRPNRHAGAHEMRERYLEDFAVGQIFGSGRLVIDKERIKSFAAEFDPQPFYLDENAAEGTLFRGLAASGWGPATGVWRTKASFTVDQVESMK
jgi:acyl dehydratase